MLATSITLVCFLLLIDSSVYWGEVSRSHPGNPRTKQTVCPIGSTDSKKLGKQYGILSHDVPQAL